VRSYPNLTFRSKRRETYNPDLAPYSGDGQADMNCLSMDAAPGSRLIAWAYVPGPLTSNMSGPERAYGERLSAAPTAFQSIVPDPRHEVLSVGGVVVVKVRREHPFGYALHERHLRLVFASASRNTMIRDHFNALIATNEPLP